MLNTLSKFTRQVMIARLTLLVVLPISLLLGCAASNQATSDTPNTDTALAETVQTETALTETVLSADHVVDDNEEPRKEKKSERLTGHELKSRTIILESESTKSQAAKIKQTKLSAPQVLAEMSFASMPSSVGASIGIPAPFYQQTNLDTNQETYAAFEPNAVMLVNEAPVSTFSIDVDTGSYTNVRRMITQGNMPPVDAVRIEEMINYFDYQYDAPLNQNQPFNIQTELAGSPWSEQHVLLKIGLKGFQPEAKQRPAANLVFLLDVSGSMHSPDKLPLLKKSLMLLSRQLNADDKVSIVVYAGASGVVLEPTNGNQSLEIETALEALRAGGSTNGKAGIQLAYQLAEKAYIPDGINRIILATDGDFNVGTRSVDALKELIEQKRQTGISLTTLGFGTGNYNDHLMEQLADTGNGQYAYIDTLKEARKVLVEELSASLLTIAKDVKIQIEFNPDHVSEYRLVGYENRVLAREDFNNDKVDAGEIGAGHTVTAIYELALNQSGANRVDPLRYGNVHEELESKSNSKELAFIKFRYKAPNQNTSQLIERAIKRPASINEFKHASQDFRFATTVAHFGETLKRSKYIDKLEYERVINHALNSKGADPLGYRSEFIQLVRLAASLDRS